MAKIGNTNSLGHRHTAATKLKMSISRKGINKSLSTRKKMSEAAKKRIRRIGWKLSSKTRANMCLAQQKRLKEGKHNSWRGDDVGYHGIHTFVIRHFGQPDTCEKCGKSGLKGRKVHWASKEHKYLRDRNEWLRLCVPCHKKYDSR